MEETQPGGGSVLTLDIADDVEGAKADGALTGCTLSLGFDRLAEDDELEVRLNGHEVVREAVSHDGWQYTIFDGQVYHTTMTQNTEEGTLITFDATDAPITKGQNELVVRLIKGKSSLQPVTLKEVRLNIRYKGKG